MYRWQAGAGGAALEVKSARPSIFDSDLSISVDGNLAVIEKQVRDDGTHVYDLTPEQVSDLRENSTAFLGMTMGFTRIPGAPDDRWGFLYRVQQGEASLPSTYEDDGAPTLTLEAGGSRQSSLTAYASNLVVRTETVVLS